MKLTDLWKASNKPTLSFELFPARTEKGAVKLETTIDQLVALKPDFVSVTFGAGGSTGSHGSGRCYYGNGIGSVVNCHWKTSIYGLPIILITKLRICWGLLSPAF